MLLKPKSTTGILVKLTIPAPEELSTMGKPVILPQTKSLNLIAFIFE